MSIGSLLVGTQEAVILSAIIDVIGGGILFSRDPVTDSRSFWFPLAIAMIIGSIAGAIGLKVVPARSFDLLLGVIIAVFGFWFIIGRSSKGESTFETSLPERCTAGDLSFSVFSGICGGLFAVSGPPIVFWLGRRFAKFAFRRALIAVFFFATIARLLTYAASGLLCVRFVTLTLYSFPGIILGVVLGNRIFLALSETWFSRVVGGVLILVSIKLIFK